MKKLWSLLLILCLASCENECYDCVQQYVSENVIFSPDAEYIVVLGDIQNYTNVRSWYPYLCKTMNWICSQKYYGHPINCILQVGDVTDNNISVEWERFYNSTYPTANDVLYVTCTGNHDYDWDNGKIYNRYSTNINKYAMFPLTKANIIEYFEAGKMENIVVANTIHGERYDILVLEFGPRVEVVEWANRYVAAHHDRKYILMTHEFLTGKGERVSSDSYAEWQIRDSSWSSPEDVWQKLVKNNDNIVCVLCGHNGFSTQLYSQNKTGRDVPQILFNLQYQDNGGDGMIQLWEFPERSDSVSVRVYNTIKREFHSDPSTSFKFRYRY